MGCATIVLGLIDPQFYMLFLSRSRIDGGVIKTKSSHDWAHAISGKIKSGAVESDYFGEDLGAQVIYGFGWKDVKCCNKLRGVVG